MFATRVGDGSPGSSRTITLNGTYRWRSFSAHTPPKRTYLHVSELVNTSTGGRVTIEYTETGGYGDGQYHWGSTLDNVHG